MTGPPARVGADVTRAAEALVRHAQEEHLSEAAVLDLVSGLLRAARA